MSFLNKILSASDGKRQKEVKPTAKSEFLSHESEKQEKKEKKVEKPIEEIGPRTGGNVVAGVIRASHVTEKAAMDTEAGKYVFRVVGTANKIEVRRAVETRYSVRVQGVNIVNTHGKERHRGKQIGWKPGFKKAIITLRKGETIDIQ